MWKPVVAGRNVAVVVKPNTYTQGGSEKLIKPLVATKGAHLMRKLPKLLIQQISNNTVDYQVTSSFIRSHAKQSYNLIDGPTENLFLTQNEFALSST